MTGKPEPDELAVLPSADENITIIEAEFEPKRKKVANIMKRGQYVVDLFAGVGPFSILIGKSVSGESVVAVDKNPGVVKLLRENIRLNRLDNVTAVEEDARHAAKNLKHSADYVIINLPQSVGSSWIAAYWRQRVEMWCISMISLMKVIFMGNRGD